MALAKALSNALSLSLSPHFTWASLRRLWLVMVRILELPRMMSSNQTAHSVSALTVGVALLFAAFTSEIGGSDDEDVASTRPAPAASLKTTDVHFGIAR